MKRLAIAAAVVLFAACSAQDEATTADTLATPPAMAPVPAAVDSAAVDSAVVDSAIVDTTVTPPPAGQ